MSAFNAIDELMLGGREFGHAMRNAKNIENLKVADDEIKEMLRSVRVTGFYWIIYQGVYQIAKYEEFLNEWHLIGIEKESHHITDRDVVVNNVPILLGNIHD